MVGERRDLDDLHPHVRTVVRGALEDLVHENLPFQVYEAYRTPQRQHSLFRQGSVTKADAWQSYHQCELAVDLVFKDDREWSWDASGRCDALWRRMNDIGRAHGLEPLSWEKPHLQLPGVRLADLRAGHYPPGGDESWAAAPTEAIENWPSGAPPLPHIGMERPAILPHDGGAYEAPGASGATHTTAAASASRDMFERAQAIIRQYERGFANNAADPGGATNFGITHTTLARWRKVPAASVEDVRTMSYEEAKDIYFNCYWSEMQCGALPAPLAVYNAGVHCGTGMAGSFLQESLIALGIPVHHDGDIGPETIGAVGRCDTERLMGGVLDRYEIRLSAYPRFDVFGKGFMNRVAHLRATCAKLLAEMPAATDPAGRKEPSTMATQAPPTAEAVLPLLSRLLELLRGQSPTPTPNTAPAPPDAGLDPATQALIYAVLNAFNFKPSPPLPTRNRMHSGRSTGRSARGLASFSTDTSPPSASSCWA